MHDTKSILIPAAGLGTRMGMNMPKSLLTVLGKPIIQHQLELIRSISNSVQVIVIVGYQARNVVDVVSAFDEDVVFVKNHNYRSTATASSLKLGAQIARERLICMDGDLLVDRPSLELFMNNTSDAVGIFKKKSQTPVLVEVDPELQFAREFGYSLDSQFEWSGLLSIAKNHVLGFDNGHVFENLARLTPIRAQEIDGFEFDTPEELKELERWILER